MHQRVSIYHSFEPYQSGSRFTMNFSDECKKEATLHFRLIYVSILLVQGNDFGIK